VEVDLITRVSVGTIEIGRELMAHLRQGCEGPLGLVQEPRLGHTGQGHRELVGHDGLNPSCSKDRGGVDL
jgi:hypothetical protein